MINIHIPASFEYDTTSASLLADTIKNVSSLEEITGWNKLANAELEEMKFFLEAIKEKQQKASEIVLQEQQTHNTKKFLVKLFDGRKVLKRWIAEQVRLEREKTQIENLVSQFQSALNFMPDSLEHARELLEDCNQQKKDLHSEMKAVNKKKSSIRAKAKVQKANTNYGKYGKGDRYRIKLNKKSALKSRNNEKTVIHRQVTELEQTIVWLERFQ